MSIFDPITRGLDRRRERLYLAACAGLCASYLVIVTSLSLAGTRMDTVFLAKREQALLRRLVQFQMPLGQAVPLTADGEVSANFVMLRGWSFPEAWGIWSIGSRAELAVALPASRPANGALQLWVTVMAPQDGKQDIRLDVDGKTVGSWKLGIRNAVLCAKLPRISATGADVIRIGFDIGQPQRPAGGDPRTLGVGLKQMSIQQGMSACTSDVVPSKD